MNSEQRVTTCDHNHNSTMCRCNTTSPTHRPTSGACNIAHPGSPALSKRPVLMRRGTLKGPIPIKMSLCLLQLSASSSGALHTPQSLLQPSTASITAGTLLCRLTCPLPTLNLRGTSVPVGRVTAPPGPGFLGTARAVRTGTKSSSPASFR